MKFIKNNKGLNKFPQTPEELTELSLFNNNIERIPDAL